MALGNYFKPREYSFEVKHADVKKSLDINAAVIIDRQTGVNYLFVLAATRGGLTP